MTTRFYVNLCTIFILCTSSLQMSMAETTEKAVKTSPASHSLSTTLLETSGILLLVVGLLFGMAFLIRRFNPQMLQHGEMQIVAAMSLGGKDRLILVNIGEEQLLLGVSPGRVGLIKNFETPIISPTEKTENLAGTFRKLLSQASRKSNDASDSKLK